ncbi:MULTISPECIES: GNAT family N-acetyltransferase [unclassified Lactobacillus]|uniref:GNAT family N-acetyltransferase n=1 Tax=unclassified Lactobacillus TaxID=2620435 RepID=UPI00223F9D23|nr:MULTISPECIES: GNAT family N-acetyltransferase [unclassified Lactobacillus]
MLNGTKVELRKVTPADAPTLYKWGQDEIYHQLAGFEKFKNLAQAQRAAKVYAERPWSYAIVLKETNEMIGLAELYDQTIDIAAGIMRAKSLGFLIDKNYWRKGYGFEAMKLLVNYAFQQLNQDVLWAEIIGSNLASEKLLEKLGFKQMYALGEMEKRRKFFVLKK